MDWTYPALTAISICASFVGAVAGGSGLITIYAGLPSAMVPGANKVQPA